MTLSNLPWAEWLGSGGIGAAVLKGSELVFGRKGREVAALGATVEALSTQLQAADDRMDRFGERLDDCHEQHEKCEASLGEVRDELAESRRQIERLMNGRPLPAYHLNASKDDPNKGSGK
jgi:hypothetical protein